MDESKKPCMQYMLFAERSKSTMKKHEQLYQIGVKGIIQNNENKILILKNRQKGFWDLPGGRVQKDESIIDALLREVDEETGLKEFQSIKSLLMFLSNIKIPLEEYFKNPNTDDIHAGLIFYYHHCILTLNQPIRLSSEHLEYQWVSVGMAKSLLTVLPETIWGLIERHEEYQF